MNDPQTIVIGLGITGKSCIRYLKDKCEVFVTDTRLNEDGFGIDRDTQNLIDESNSVNLVEPSQLSEFSGQNTRLIVTPGVPLTSPEVQKCIEAGFELTSDIDLFLDAFPGRVVGVTGTNGKSTVVAGRAQMLASRGYVGAGNIGTPVLDLFDDAPDGVVLELSSFQLERMRTHHLNSAALLNVSDDHLDHHRDFESYKRAKLRIFADCDLAVYNADDEHTFPDSSAQSIAVNGDRDWWVYDDFLLIRGRAVKRSEVRLLGDHNAFNLVVASALADHEGVLHNEIVETLSVFEGLEHRTKCIGRINGVNYVDDSKATNVGATNAALNAFGSRHYKNLILIAGGIGKQGEFRALRTLLREFVHHTILFGRDSDLIAEAIEGSVAWECVPDLNAAVLRASQFAKSDDIVLFSPACASFDQFEHYAQRGEAFASAVRELAA